MFVWIIIICIHNKSIHRIFSIRISGALTVSTSTVLFVFTMSLLVDVKPWQIPAHGLQFILKFPRVLMWCYSIQNANDDAKTGVVVNTNRIAMMRILDLVILSREKLHIHVKFFSLESFIIAGTIFYYYDAQLKYKPWHDKLYQTHTKIFENDGC